MLGRAEAMDELEGLRHRKTTQREEVVQSFHFWDPEVRVTCNEGKGTPPSCGDFFRGDLLNLLNQPSEGAPFGGGCKTNLRAPRTAVQSEPI